MRGGERVLLGKKPTKKKEEKKKKTDNSEGGRNKEASVLGDIYNEDSC